MNCLDKQQIFDFINNEVIDNDRRIFEHHIGNCPSCKKLYDEVAEEVTFIKNSIDEFAIPKIQVPEFSFSEQAPQVKTKRIFPLILKISIAASLLILISLSILLLNQKKQDNLDLQILQFDQEMQITDMNEAWHNREIIFTEMNTRTGDSESYLSTDIEQ